MELAGRNVLVMGLARTGVAAARFLLGRGARVSATDLRAREELGDPVASLEAAGCRLRLGEHRLEDFRSADLVVVSPGIPLDVEPLAAARRAGIEIIGEVELACRHLSCPVVGVTGTNGKTTTVSLIHRMLAEAGVPHWLGGNIGKPLCAFLAGGGHGQAEGEPRVVVAELSSFQLETIRRFRPSVAVWTNLSDDHLDRYPDLESYATAKARIFMNQQPEDHAVVPAEDPWLDPDRVGIRAGILRFGRAGETSPEIRLEEDGIRFQPPGGDAEEHYPTAGVRLPGGHNLENIMAALAAARLSGADPAAVRRAMEGFRGLEHRVEHVGTCRGVRFYNDSKATTIHSVVRALESFADPVLLLAGGRHKGGDLTLLREPVRRHVRRLFLFGEAADRMAAALNGSTETERVADMEEALAGAWSAARPGDVVLLSPACASFDQFRDYEQRGTIFKDLVRGILQRGAPGEGT